MRTSWLRYLLLLVALCGAAPVAQAQSQRQMNAQALAEFEEADGELNQIYKKLIKTLDEDAQEKLKTAQRAWIAMRDAEAEFQATLDASGGSMYPMVLQNYRMELTQTRTNQLRRLLNSDR